MKPEDPLSHHKDTLQAVEGMASNPQQENFNLVEFSTPKEKLLDLEWGSSREEILDLDGGSNQEEILDLAELMSRPTEDIMGLTI